MVDLLGLPRRATFRDRIGYGVVVDDATCEAVQAASGLTQEAIRQAHLSAFDGTALSLNGLAFDDTVAFEVAARREWTDFYGSRACPRCLAESGGVWQLWWKLSWAAVCPAHRCLLIDVCPECGSRLRRGHRARPAALSLVRDRHPASCGTSLDRRTVCEARLDAVSAIPVEQTFGRAQAQLVAAAHGTVGAPPVGWAGSGGQWFAALKAIAVVVRIAAPTWTLPLPKWAAEAVLAEVDEARSGAAWATVDARPATPAAAAGLLLVASTLLASVGRDGYAEVLDPLTNAAGLWQRRVLRDPLRIACLPPELERYLALRVRRFLRISR